MVLLEHGRRSSRSLFRPSLLALALATGLAGPLAAQMSSDQAAALMLSSARRAYNDRNYSFAAARFREFLAKFGGHKQAPAARYGLALCLIEADRNYTEAAQNLQPLAGDKALPEHPFALYYLGHCQRGLGIKELEQARAKPQEANQRRTTARQRFDEASRHYAGAVAAFTGRAKKPAEDARELPLDLEWAARARCDQAEMLLRLLKPKEALAAVAPFLDGPLLKSRYRRLALYHHGFGSFLLGDYNAAGKSLNQLTPFSDPAFGTHARYLLARVHHLSEERAEAAGHYKELLTQHTREVRDASEALKNPAVLDKDPVEKARLTALANGPTPDHIARASLYLGLLDYEAGNFAEALTRLNDFVKANANSALLPEAQLRVGFCQVQLKQFADALKTLKPIADKHPPLADQALLWLARAEAGAADPKNAAAWLQAHKNAIETLRRAAGLVGGNEPAVRGRRGLVLLEMIDVQQAAKMYREAAATCTQILNDKLLPERAQEVLQRQATALHLAGDYTESDKVCVRFRDTYPKSPLLPAVLFRHAENAAFAALAAEKKTDLPNRAQTLAKLRDEAIQRYQVVVEKFPEFPHVNLARYGLALGHYRKGEVEKARDILERIPQAERNGELAAVNYALADCLIRLAPTEAEDALAAGKLTEQMNKAIELLSAFTGGPARPEAPDALLKLGYCHQKLAEVLAQPPEKAKALASARAAYEQLMQKFPQSPLQPQAVFERARCLARANDVNGAVNELRRFTGAPLRDAAVAPMANLRLATLLRRQNKAAEAVKVLADCRQAHEASLLKDPARAGWVPLLQYHQGLALKESGKLAEARQILEGVVRSYPNAPEAVEAALRNGQCLKDEGVQKVELARKQLAQPGRKPDQQAQDRRLLDDGLKLVRDAVTYLEGQASQLKQKKADSPVRARMLYDAAWAARVVAEQEVESARGKLRQERWQKLKDAAAKKAPPGQQPPHVPPPEVPLADVPSQPAEKKTRDLYQTLLADFPDLESNADARFELAELLSERQEHDAAVKLLQDALDREPKPELIEKIKLRLGVCLAAKGDSKGALAHFEAVARNEKSPLRPQAVYRAGECLMQAKDYDGAVKKLTLFRDFGPFQNLPGLTDRALLRLGHALGQLKQWDASRQAHEQVVSRFPQGPWRDEARYGIGWAHQNKKEYDPAVNAYNQVTAAVATELGARAQLNIGLCRLAQQRYAEASTALLVVPFTYDYPELSAVALLEAARALTGAKERDKARAILKRLLRDHPNSSSAEAARQRLEELEGG